MPDFRSLLKVFPDDFIFVDIPIGLPPGGRTLESAARKLLDGRRSTIFPVPCREAVYADEYRQACEINQRQTGRKLSVQTWNICEKIREVDQVLLASPRERSRIFESHPELAFQRMKGAALIHSKKTAEGLVERMAILRPILPGAAAWYEMAIAAYPRKAVGRDDIVDAMVLTAVGSLKETSTISGDETADELGIPIRMIVPGAHRS